MPNIPCTTHSYQLTAYCMQITTRPTSTRSRTNCIHFPRSDFPVWNQVWRRLQYIHFHYRNAKPPSISQVTWPPPKMSAQQARRGKEEERSDKKRTRRRSFFFDPLASQSLISHAPTHPPSSPSLSLSLCVSSPKARPTPQPASTGAIRPKQSLRQRQGSPTSLPAIHIPQNLLLGRPPAAVQGYPLGSACEPTCPVGRFCITVEPHCLSRGLLQRRGKTQDR